ncbi:hypothetical protein [Acinetobacter sp. NCu2D-2]|uniref:hypothetical protein n=1 Tax=Acinetobacter sp. NCu2D-2 TaxID=1608473 RepID=UPI0012FE8E23|nr:hypothetical protein [Acinetobacter sp. NCu2D-2]
MDLKNVALRSSDGKILNFRTQKSAFWRPAQTQLLIQCHDLAEPIWFNIDLTHVFSTQYFRQIEVEANPKLIGQQVHFYYLAASKCIIQMYSQSQNNDFSILKRYLEQPYAHQVIIEQIPTRLIQDLPNIIRIEAVRDHQKSFDLKLRTSYGHIYQVQSSAKAFDQLELALASLLDFVSYRRFKQNLDIKHSIVSKPHPYRYRNLIIYSLLLILPILSVVTGNWLFVILAIGIYWFYIKTSIQQQVPPFISEEHY